MVTMIVSEDADRLRSLSWRGLEDLVAEIVQHELPTYLVRREARVGPLAVDILAEPRTATLAESIVIFEVKRVQVASIDLITSEVGRRELVRAHHPGARYVFVTTGGVTRRAREVAERYDLTVWDANVLAAKVTPEMATRWFGIAYEHADRAGVHPERPQITKAQALISALGSIAAGKGQELVYQKWVRDVMEYLFVPPLGPAHYENADAAGRNRRDLILENWATDGFWSQMRTLYSAEQIVIDAKNSAQPLGKRPVIEIAHYLKPYGCGLFGILCCRKGPGEPAKHAIREQWIGGRKLIVTISDEVLVEMLTFSEAGTPAEELLRRELGRFRMSL
jgi:hypothetical protein